MATACFEDEKVSESGSFSNGQLDVDSELSRGLISLCLSTFTRVIIGVFSDAVFRDAASIQKYGLIVRADEK